MKVKVSCLILCVFHYFSHAHGGGDQDPLEDGRSAPALLNKHFSVIHNINVVCTALCRHRAFPERYPLPESLGDDATEALKVVRVFSGPLTCSATFIARIVPPTRRHEVPVDAWFGHRQDIVSPRWRIWTEGHDLALSPGERKKEKFNTAARAFLETLPSVVRGAFDSYVPYLHYSAFDGASLGVNTQEILARLAHFGETGLLSPAQIQEILATLIPHTSKFSPSSPNIKHFRSMTRDWPNEEVQQYSTLLTKGHFLPPQAVSKKHKADEPDHPKAKRRPGRPKRLPVAVAEAPSPVPQTPSPTPLCRAITPMTYHQMLEILGIPGDPALDWDGYLSDGQQDVQDLLSVGGLLELHDLTAPAVPDTGLGDTTPADLVRIIDILRADDA